MSGIVPLIWAFKVAPVKDGIEKLVLCALADAADEDGCNAFIAQATVARRAMVDTRTVRRRIADLEKRGLLKRGDQAAASHYPPDKRPVVWDVMIPYTAFGDGIESVNAFREDKGRPPLTAKDRPSLGPAPDTKIRKDKGQPKPPKREDSETGGTSSPAGQGVRPDAGAEPSGLEDRSRGDLKSDNLPPTNLPLNLPQRAAEPLRDPAPEGGQQVLIVVEGATDGASETRAIGTSAERANALADGWWKYYQATYGPIVSKGSSRPFFALRDGVVLKAIEAGYTEKEIKHALMRTGNGKNGNIPDAIPDKQRFQRVLVEVRQQMPAHGGAGATVHQMPVDDPDRQRRATAW